MSGRQWGTLGWDPAWGPRDQQEPRKETEKDLQGVGLGHLTVVQLLLRGQAGDMQVLGRDLPARPALECQGSQCKVVQGCSRGQL